MTLILSDVKFNFTTEAFDFETVNDETVLYFKEIKKVLVLNNTCSMIWKMIAECQQEDGELSDEMIAVRFMEQFNLPEEERKNVKNDIYVLFQNFLAEKVVQKKLFT